MSLPQTVYFSISNFLFIQIDPAYCPVIKGGCQVMTFAVFLSKKWKVFKPTATSLVFKEAEKWCSLSVFLLLPPVRVRWSKGLASDDLLLYFFQRNGKFSNWPATCLVFKEARKWWPLSVFLLLPPVLWSKGLASNDLYYVSSLPPPVQWLQGMASDDLCCVSFLLPPVQCSKGLASNDLYCVSSLPPPVQDHRGWQVMTFVVFICYHHHQFVLRKNKTLWNMFFILLLN